MKARGLIRTSLRFVTKSRFALQIDNHPSPEKIGAKEYNSANASVYRAINRLESRGLIRRLEESGTRLQLTDSGVAVARQLVLEESQS